MGANTLLRRLLWRQPAGESLSRRRFLAGLGVLAGAGALAPLALARSRRAGRSAVEASRPALGTWVRVVARDADRAPAPSARIEARLRRHARVDAQMSIHRADSQLCARQRRRRPRRRARRRRAARRGRRALRRRRARTGGVYDPTVLPLMRLYGFYASRRTRATRRPRDRRGAARASAGSRCASTARPARSALARARRRARPRFDRQGLGGGPRRRRAARRGRRAPASSTWAATSTGSARPSDGAAGWSVGVLHPGTGARRPRLRAARRRGRDQRQHRADAARSAAARVGPPARRAPRAGPPTGRSQRERVARAPAPTPTRVSTVAFLLGPDALPRLAGRARRPLHRVTAVTATTTGCTRSGGAASTPSRTRSAPPAARIEPLTPPPPRSWLPLSQHLGDAGRADREEGRPGARAARRSPRAAPPACRCTPRITRQGASRSTSARTRRWSTRAVDRHRAAGRAPSPSWSSPRTRTGATLPRDEALARIREAGIVGLGGAAFPT